ncbi:MAG: lytic transglycosylase domain-containing protein [bacterium]
MVTITGGLLDKLKLKNRPLYDWFLSRSIDLQNLGKFTSSLAMAISLATAQPVMPPQPESAIPATQSYLKIEPTELRGKTDLERASLVWARYGHLIRNSAAEYGLEPDLIFATIMVESGGNTYAVRQEPRIHDASYGLGQLLYGTARGLGYRGKPDGLYDPAVNIDLIAHYHKRNFDRYQDLNPQELTIAYNTGSPYKRALPGHLSKFDKWYNSLANLEVDLS